MVAPMAEWAVIIAAALIVYPAIVIGAIWIFGRR